MESELSKDFKEFLKLLHAHGVRHLVIGGHAVSYYGYARATLDLDVWIAVDPENAQRAVEALREFGFDTPELSPALFLNDNSIVRMGVPPLRIEILTTISGVRFEECYPNRVVGTYGGVEVTLISLRDLKKNKAASGRAKDIADLERLP